MRKSSGRKEKKERTRKAGSGVDLNQVKPFTLRACDKMPYISKSIPPFWQEAKPTFHRIFFLLRLCNIGLSLFLVERKSLPLDGLIVRE